MGTARDENRIAKIRMNTMDLHHLLGMPESMQIEMVIATQDPPGINLVVSGVQLEAQPYDTEAPFLPGHFRGETIRVDDKIYRYWNWDPRTVVS
jgi:hypothetical protein